MSPFAVRGSGALMVRSSRMPRRPGIHPDPDVVAITVDAVRLRVFCHLGHRNEISRNCLNGRGIAC